MLETKFKGELIKSLSGRFCAYRIENKVALGMPDVLVSRAFYEKPHIWIETKVDSWLNQNQEIWMKGITEEVVLIAYLRDRDFSLYKRNEEKTWVVIFQAFWPLTNKVAHLLSELILKQ